MKHQLIPNTDLNVSSYCYGVMFFGTRAKGDDAYRLYEQFVEAGGNLFDSPRTASSAGCRRATAQASAPWATACESSATARIRSFSTKGALIQTPAILSPSGRHDDGGSDRLDISESLERLRIDYIDLYTPAPGRYAPHRGRLLKSSTPRSGAPDPLSGRQQLDARPHAGSERLRRDPRPAGVCDIFPAVEPLRRQPPAPTTGTAIGRHLPRHDRRGRGMAPQDRLPMMPWTPSAYGYLSGLETSNAMSFDNPTSRRRRERAREWPGRRAVPRCRSALRTCAL